MAPKGSNIDRNSPSVKLKEKLPTKIFFMDRSFTSLVEDSFVAQQK
jgi:hypothetical protein